jgi:hypothetical protein
MQNSSPKRVYRPVLLERPSMTKFIVLSVLMHIWAIALLGDASDGANNGARGTFTGSGWASTFTAKLSQRVKAGAASVAAFDSSKSTKQPASAAVTNQVDNATAANATAVSTTSAALATPATIEPIPVIAVETINPVSDFIVPSLNIEPIVAPQSTATTNFAAIVLPPELPTERVRAGKADENFAIYVPPIIERARIETSNIQPAIAPLQAVAPPILATKEFAPTPLQAPAPKPVVAAIAAVPDIATVAAAVLPEVAPTVPALTIAPIEKITLPPTASREFAPAPSNAISPAVDTSIVKSDAAAASSTRANLGTTVNEKVNIEKDIAGASRGGASALNPSANTGGGDGLSSLLPIIPVRPATPTLDLDKLRQRAREVAVEGSGPRMLLPFPTVAKPAEKRNIEKIFDKALKRPDCKDEYADLGLAAVVPLVRDAIKGTGCKW